MSPAGKADRRAIEALLRDRIGATSAPEPVDYLMAAVERWLDRPVDRDGAGLLDLGVGSLTTARLAAEIACRYQVRLELAEMIRAPTLRDLAELVRRRAAS